VRPLCVTCHQGIGDQLANEVNHPPAEDDDGCTSCHGPHLTANANLLLAPVAETCLGCHDGKSIEFADKHLGAAAETIDCGECHDPHASQVAGMLLPEAHMPFAEGDCTTCHQERPEGQGETQ
jgi:predicted CXXCH cytochrome family protein